MQEPDQFSEPVRFESTSEAINLSCILPGRLVERHKQARDIARELSLSNAWPEFHFDMLDMWGVTMRQRSDADNVFFDSESVRTVDLLQKEGVPVRALACNFAGERPLLVLGADDRRHVRAVLHEGRILNREDSAVVYGRRIVERAALERKYQALLRQGRLCEQVVTDVDIERHKVHVQALLFGLLLDMTPPEITYKIAREIGEIPGTGIAVLHEDQDSVELCLPPLKYYRDFCGETNRTRGLPRLKALESVEEELKERFGGEVSTSRREFTIGHNYWSDQTIAGVILCPRVYLDEVVGIIQELGGALFRLEKDALEELDESMWGFEPVSFLGTNNVVLRKVDGSFQLVLPVVGEDWLSSSSSDPSFWEKEEGVRAEEKISSLKKAVSSKIDETVNVWVQSPSQHTSTTRLVKRHSPVISGPLDKLDEVIEIVKAYDSLLEGKKAKCFSPSELGGIEL